MAPKQLGFVLVYLYSQNAKLSFVIRQNQSGGPEHKTHWSVNFAPNTWTHLTVVMQHVPGQGVREIIYVNGKQADVEYLGI